MGRKHKKGMKVMKRFICLILVLITVLALMVGCKRDENESNVTTSPDGNVEPPQSQLGIFDPTELRARNEAEEKIMYVLSYDALHSEFEVTADQISVNELNAAVYERDNQVKNALGIKEIRYNEQKGTHGYSEEYAQYIERVGLNGDSEIDIIATYSRTAGLCAQKGFYSPINFYKKYVNLNNAWYPKQLVNEVAIKDNVYYVSGDISPNLLYLTYAFVFNKELMQKLNFDYMKYYEMAENGKWTLDEMYKLCSYYEDADGDGKKSDGDGFGLRTYYYNMDAIYSGSNLKLVTVNNKAEKVEDLITVAEDFTGSKAIDLCDDLGAFLTSEYAYTDKENNSETFASTRNTIGMISRIRFIGLDIQVLDDKLPVGVLPVPKYNEAQEDYKCITGNPFTLWGIFSGNMDLAREESAAGFIEYMGYFGMENTTEAVFADTFLGRYADQPDDANQFNIIRRSTSFDVGRVFAAVISPNAYMSELWSKAACRGAKWTSTFQRYLVTYVQNSKTASEDFWKLSEQFKNPYDYPYAEQ